MAESDLSISQMTAGQTQAGSIFPGINPDQNSASGYSNFGFSATDMASAFLQFLFPLNLNTNNKSVFGAINELAAAGGDDSTDITDLLVWTANTAILSYSGLPQASTNFKSSGFYSVTGYKEIKITVPIYTSSQGTQALYSLSFYDANRTFINSPYVLELGPNANKNITLTIPGGAAYFRTTYFNDSYDAYIHNVPFKAILNKATIDELREEVDTISNQVNTHVHLGQEEINRFYAIKSDGIFESSVFGVTSYINCKGVNSITVKMPVLAPAVTNQVGLDFYDDTKTKISFVPADRADSNSANIKYLIVPDNACYFRCSYWNYDNLSYGGEWSCDFYTSEYKTHRPYQSGYIFFSPKVNQSINQYWDNSFDTELDLEYKDTNSVLLLPSNYDPDGAPVPVIMYFHGYSHSVYYDTWGADADFRTQKQQWADQGFAVIDCNGARTNNKTSGFTSGGSLQYVDGYHKTFEYVKKHYNVEQYCHVICASAGGIAGINYVYWFNDAKSLLMLSAWTSLENNSYASGVTNTMVEYLGCDFSSGYAATKDKTIGFDPTLRILTINGVDYLPALPVPAKAMLGSTEENNHIWLALNKFVGALRNAGQSVSLRVVTGATHKQICSGADQDLNTEYANWCKSI